MMRKEKWSFQIFFSVVIFCLTAFWVLLNSTAAVFGQEPLEYNLEVSAQIIPFFAVDVKGNPVFDLNSEELTLSVNGKPCDIYFLKKTEIAEEKEVISHPGEEKPGEKIEAEKLPAGNNQPRVKFIIIDTVFNSDAGIRRSKEIAVNLVKKQAVNDRFIILLNTFSGLQYITGPESDENVLVTKIEKLNILPEKHLRDLFIEEKNSSGISSEISNFRDYGYILTKGIILAETLKYKTDLIRFAKSLTQFKYALQTINSAKIVFLISEGVKKGAFLEEANPENKDSKFFKTYLYRYLKEIGKAINNGGSVLYTINSQKTGVDEISDENNLSDGSLVYLANEGGGKYFSGSNVTKIVSSIEKTTSAYYEATFTPGPAESGLLKIDIKCKREGVQIYTINYTEKTQPYINMPPERKKLFAFDVISGGNWSRMVGKVMKVKFKTLKKEKNGNEEIYSIQAPLPGEMQDRKLEVFSIGVDAASGKVTVSAVRNQAKDILNFKIKCNQSIKQSFVIIEPTTPRCLYNEIN
ncbi:MAG TPA: hypothetical protein VK186_06570 [Candidatus Deferrimicrobium sp.]|nr:hypothetical protein [Candidatus Deferrimicrobium sp.]